MVLTVLYTKDILSKNPNGELIASYKEKVYTNGYIDRIYTFSVNGLIFERLNQEGKNVIKLDNDIIEYNKYNTFDTKNVKIDIDSGIVISNSSDDDIELPSHKPIEESILQENIF